MKIVRFVILFSLLLSGQVVLAGRADSLDYRLGIGYAIFPGIPDGDAGLSLEFRLKKNIYLQAAYYYSFFGFKIVQSGGSDAYEYNPMQGYKLQAGLRFYHKHRRSMKIYFREFRLGYKNMDIPKYTNRDGPNGRNAINREVLSIHNDIFKAGFVVGEKQYYTNRFYLEESGSLGIEYRQQTDHLYSYGGGNQYQNGYPENTFRHKNYILPYIEISVRAGFGI